MGSKIRILDDQTINQIAAGEVIENGASVIKELIDNSIDAESSHIVIDVAGSGRQITVQDNGCGMIQDDVLLCLERHATSKIATQEDLWRLKTMGFRGEALAAISSVSHFSLLTAPSFAASESSSGLIDGTSLVAIGGKIKSCQPTKTLAGTKITVSDLFYNVPARRKFLKAPARESVDIVKVVTLAALSHPQIGFELVLNQKREFLLQPQEMRARIEALLGGSFISDLLEVSFSNEWLSIKGFIGKPAASKANRTGQYLFVNSRPVTSMMISSQVKEAYGSSLEEGRHPIFVLYVEMTPDRLDCNVHPQKREVRFSFEDELKRHIVGAVSHALFTSSRKAIAPVAFSLPARYEEKRFEENCFDFSQKPTVSFQTEIVPDENPFSIVGIYEDYILVTFEVAGDLYFVDSRKALAMMLASSKADGSSQMLLVPYFVEFSAQEASQLQLRLDELQEKGFSIRSFGVSSFLVEAVPSSFEHIDVEEFLRYIASSADVALDSALKTPTFQKSIKALGAGMAPYIIKKLLACPDPFSCMMSMKKKEIAERFL